MTGARRTHVPDSTIRSILDHPPNKLRKGQHTHVDRRKDIKAEVLGLFHNRMDQDPISISYVDLEKR
jgi:hypothetical protein